MSGTPAPVRRSLPARLVPGPVRTVARHAWGVFRYAPWPVKIMLAVIGVGGPAAVAYRYGVHRVRSAQARVQVAEWRNFAEAVRAGDEGRMMAALDGVLAKNPTDPTALGRKRALEVGEADAADQDMVTLSVRRHLRAGRLGDAAREAGKRLGAEPRDWFSRCVVAAHKLQSGDPAGATADLDKLPAPGDAAARLDPGGLLLAARLFKATGRDLTPIRQFTQGIILPILRSPGAAHLPAAEKTALVECYAEAFDPTPGKPQPASVVEGWAAAARLADAALDEALEAKDAGVLTRVGRLGEPLGTGLGFLRRSDQLSADEARPLAGDLRDRTRKAWAAAVAADPTSAEAHRGLATAQLQAVDAAPPADKPALYDEARKTLVAGLQARPDDPDLAGLFGRLLAVEGRPLQATQYLVAQAHKHPDRPVWWAMAAEAAVAANRPDLALEACGKLRERDPDNRWAVRTEARLWLNAGEPARALSTLGRVADADLLRDPLAAYPFARALAETRTTDRLDRFVAAAAEGEKPAGVVGAVARGLADADPARFPPADLQARAAGLLDRFPDHPDVLRAAAAAAYRLAENGDPVWDPARVRAAVRAVEQALRTNPDDPDLLLKLGWLRLGGENNAALAARAVAPLKAPTVRPTPRQSELLGAVALAANELPAAVAHLEQATAAPDPPAGAFALLARAHHAAGRPGPARTALDAARSRPRTPREQADYLVAARQVANP